MSQKKFDPFRRFEELPSRLYVIFAVILFGAHIVICSVTEASPALMGLILVIAYLILSAAIYILSRRKLNVFKTESDASEEHNNGMIFAFKNHIKIPYAIVTESGKVITVNHAMRQTAGIWDTVFNSDIASICGLGMNEILFQTEEELRAEEEKNYDGEYDIQKEEVAKKECIVTIADRLYHVSCHAINSGNKPYYLRLHGV